MSAESNTRERLAETRETVKSHSRRIRRLEDDNDMLARLVVVVEMQDARNAKQDEQLDRVGQTLSNIDDNLTHLNSTSGQLKQDIGELGSRINSIEDSQKNYQIDIPALLVKLMIGIVMVIPAIILAWLLIKLGLK